MPKAKAKVYSGLVTRHKKKLTTFERYCKCDQHEVFSVHSNSKRLYTIGSHSYSRRCLNWLIENGHFSSKSKTVCEACLEYARKRLLTDDSSSSQHPVSPEAPVSPGGVMSIDASDEEIDAEETRSPEVEAVVNLLNSGKMCDDDLLYLCENLGNYLNSKVFDDTKAMTGRYKDIINLQKCDDYFDDRVEGVVRFLRSCTRTKNEMLGDSTRDYKLCLLIEQLYGARNSKFVGPFSSSQGVVKWSFCGSKAAHVIMV